MEIYGPVKIYINILGYSFIGNIFFISDTMPDTNFNKLSRLMINAFLLSSSDITANCEEVFDLLSKSASANDVPLDVQTVSSTGEEYH